MPIDFYRSQEWEKLRLKVLRRDRWRCSQCGCQCRGAKFGEPRPFVDHIVPRRKGGPDTMENLTSMCLPCHSRKTAYVDLNTRVKIGADGFPEGSDWS